MSTSGRQSNLEFAGQLPPYGHADQHAKPGLLGQERPHGPRPLVDLFPAHGARNLALAQLAEVAVEVERLVQDVLELGCDARDARLGLAEAVGLGERLQRAVDLLVREPALGHDGVSA